MFQPAKNTSAYLKAALLGFPGSGKSKTAAKIAIGLSHHLKNIGVTTALTPVYFLDTETGSDWLIPDFKEAGVPLQTWKTRAFANLVEAVKLAEKDRAILLGDSATHFWTELCTSYSRQKAQRFNRPNYRLNIGDWGHLKGPECWGKFSERFVNAPVHFIIAGRAGYEFDTSEDDDGNKQLEKTGVKMKIEGEFGFEPSLLLYMERHQRMKGDEVEEVWREATVMKDRADLIDGKSFKNPGFDDFLPHISRLALGGSHLGVDGSSTPATMIPVDKGDRTGVMRSIVIDEIGDLLMRHGAAGTSKEAQLKRSDLMQAHFGTVSKTKIEEAMSLFDLRAGYDSLHQELEGKPSRYAIQAAVTTTPQPLMAGDVVKLPQPSLRQDMNDDLPDFAKAPADAMPVVDYMMVE